ncbi:MAG: ABC transporter ATP-binding protein [Bryobacteraceae bacterium]|jgi:phospholipid/cholesterol/gamma-HCH transport system ATP-binding protein
MPATAESPISVNDVYKAFGSQKVLDGVSLRVARGETLAVLGKSGTGKSVLLKLLIGLEAPDSGSIQVHGQDIVKLDSEKLNEVRKRIGFLFQQAALYDSLTVEQNVAFPLSHGRNPEAKQRERVRELLESVGMEEHAHKLPSEISGGMQKRVGLARALVLDPDILLFDEPTAGLDPITAAEIDDLIVKSQEKRKLTAIVVTHDIRGAKTFADRLVLMRDGQIVAEGTFAQLRKSQDEFVQQFVGVSSAG